MKSLYTALQAFDSSALRYPTTAEGLAALTVKPEGLAEDQWKGPYLASQLVDTDPYGTAYRYRCPSEHGNDYDLISAGPDKKFGTDDDISLFEDVPDAR